MYRKDALDGLKTTLTVLEPSDQVRLFAVDLFAEELTKGFVAPKSTGLNGNAGCSASSSGLLQCRTHATSNGGLHRRWFEPGELAQQQRIPKSDGQSGPAARSRIQFRHWTSP